jgi:hypothetical protein
MKKEYIKPEISEEDVMLELMLIGGSDDYSEGMGSNETPGGDDDFNSSARDAWGSLW